MCAVLPVLSFGKDWDCIVDDTMYSLDDENKTAQVKTPTRHWHNEKQ